MNLSLSPRANTKIALNRVYDAKRPRHLTCGRVHASRQYEALKELHVRSVEDGALYSVLSLLETQPGNRCLLAFLTHWADLGSWEYAQGLTTILENLSDEGIELRCIGLGSVEAGRQFSDFTQLPTDTLYADPSGICCKALDFEKGFGPDLEISPYLKLFPMLLGVSSAGTIPEVLRGYAGDRNRGPIFKRPTPFDILGNGYQRPFELATRRLDNMIKVLSNWDALSPADTRLLTQQGGTLLFNGQEVAYEHRDTGILMTPKIDDLLNDIRSVTDVTTQCFGCLSGGSVKYDDVETPQVNGELDKKSTREAETTAPPTGAAKPNPASLNSKKVFIVEKMPNDGPKTPQRLEEDAKLKQNGSPSSISSSQEETPAPEEPLPPQPESENPAPDTHLDASNNDSELQNQTSQTPTIPVQNEDTTHRSRVDALSCHPVLTMDWSLASSINSDEEDGDGNASDYE